MRVGRELSRFTGVLRVLLLALVGVDLGVVLGVIFLATAAALFKSA